MTEIVVSEDVSLREEVAETAGFLRREPILTDKSALYGYELFYRDVKGGCDGDRVAQGVIDNFLLLMPRIEVGRGFVPCTRATLQGKLTTLLSRRTSVLQLTSGIEPDAELLATCRELRRVGYRFALEMGGGFQSRLPLVDLADYIRIDYRTAGAEERKKIQAAARRSRIENKLIGVGVDTAAEFDLARAEGCQLFQGGVFALPPTVTNQVMPSSQAVCLRLMAALCDENVDTSKIEGLVMMDASLCYRLLRLVNSALYSLKTEVTSIRAALLVVGTDEFKKLVKVSLAGSLAAGRAKSIVTSALERARFCEMLAAWVHEPAGKLYLLGMLSQIDLILKVSMVQVLELLPLDGDMKAALLGGQSGIGLPLELIRSYQAGSWDECEEIRMKLGLEQEMVSKMYLEAVAWAEESMQS